MIRTFAAVVVILLSYAATAAPQDKIQQGSALFSSQKCVMCHSVGTRGNKKGALDAVGAKLKADDIRQWLLNPAEMRTRTNSTRTPEMKDLKLSKDQIEALVAFLQTQKATVADAAR